MRPPIPASSGALAVRCGRSGGLRIGAEAPHLGGGSAKPAKSQETFIRHHRVPQMTGSPPTSTLPAQESALRHRSASSARRQVTVSKGPVAFGGVSPRGAKPPPVPQTRKRDRWSGARRCESPLPPRCIRGASPPGGSRGPYANPSRRRSSTTASGSISAPPSCVTCSMSNPTSATVAGVGDRPCRRAR